MADQEASTITPWLERLRSAHERVRNENWLSKQPEENEPPLFVVEEQVWVSHLQKKKGKNAKLQPRFVGPYMVSKVLPNRTYKVSREGKKSIQHESWLKSYIERGSEDTPLRRKPTDGPPSIPDAAPEAVAPEPEAVAPEPVDDQVTGNCYY